MASESSKPKAATPTPSSPPPVHSAGAPHSAVTPKPAAVTHIPPAPHPSAVKAVAAKAGAAPAVAQPKAASAEPKATVAKPSAGSKPAASASATAKLASPAAEPEAAPAKSSPAQPAAAPRATVPEKPVTAADSSNPSFKLPAVVYSPQLLESVIYDLQFYLDWIRQNRIRKQVGAKPKEEPNHSDETVVVIKEWLNGKPATLESIEALLDHLKNLQLPEVHIMLAALPNRAQRAALVDWFRNNTTQELLLSFVADRNLGGGIVVRTPNRVFDFTWKQELIAARDKLAGIVRSV